MSEKKIKLINNLGITFIIFFLMLVSLEGILRYLGYPIKIYEYNKITKLDHNAGVSYLPLVVNKLGDYPGQLETDVTGFIHNGVRRTNEELVKGIFIFGGSTVEGRGSSGNTTTIPAKLENCIRSNKKKNINVINSGFSGDYSYQEIKRAMDVIGKYNPKAIIFLNVRNDAHYAQIENNIAFDSNNGINGPFEYANELIGNKNNLLLREKFAIVSWASAIKNNFEIKLKANEKRMSLKNSDDILKSYIASMKAIHAVANEFKIDIYVFMQPTLLANKKILTEKETEIHDKFLKRKNLTEEYFQNINKFYNDVEKEAVNMNFYDISNIFKYVNETVYVDSVHYNDKGNQIIANKICNIVSNKINE